MSNAFDLPLAMLATSVAFRPDGTATLSGLWYFKNQELPSTQEGRKAIAVDLAGDRCVRVDLVGTQRQIAELLMLAVAAGTEEDTMEALARMRVLLEKLTSTPRGYHDFDNIHDPQGTVLPVDFPVRVDADFPSIKETLFSHPDLIRLQLQAGWSLWNEIQSSL